MSHRILLGDDHRIVRQGLRSLLERQADFEVIGETADGRATVVAAKRLKPDIVLMDVAMPELNGVEATAQIVAHDPGVLVIALSMHSDTRFVSRMLRAGARGYVVKNCAFEEVATAVRTVATGETYLSPEVTGIIVQDYLRQQHDGVPSHSSPLTAREREVLQLLAEGRTTRRTAELLFVSIKTIETHRRQIMEKLDIRSVATLTKYAIREGLTEVE